MLENVNDCEARLLITNPALAPELDALRADLHGIPADRDVLVDGTAPGGVNAYPRDIEEVAAQHPEVAEVAVFGIADARWGETPVAAVTLRACATATAGEIEDWVNERVEARYQKISGVLVLDVFPRNAAGKTLRREMREMYSSGGEGS